jgi:hypothetical protein
MNIDELKVSLPILVPIKLVEYPAVDLDSKDDDKDIPKRDLSWMAEYMQCSKELEDLKE